MYPQVKPKLTKSQIFAKESAERAQVFKLEQMTQAEGRGLAG